MPRPCRRAASFAATLLTTALLTLGLTHPAGAAPTASPSASPTATPSASATPSATASASSEPAAASTSTDPTASAQPSSSASSPKAKSPAKTPQAASSKASTPKLPRHQVGLTATQLREFAITGRLPKINASSVRTTRRASAPARSAVLLLAFGNCAATSAGGSLQFGLAATDRSTEVDWTVRVGSVTKTGTAQVAAGADIEDEDGLVEVSGLPIGPVTLEIREHNSADVIDQAELSVLNCVRAVGAPCQASFSNPVGNPGVTVFNDGEDSQLDRFAQLKLGSGEQGSLVSEPGPFSWVAIRTADLESLEGDGTDDGDDSAFPIVVSLAGEAKVMVSSCGATFLTPEVSCLGAGQKSQLVVDLPPNTLRQRDIAVSVSSFTGGSVGFTVNGKGNGSSASYTFDTTKLKTGAYRALLLTPDGTQIISVRTFAVVECVKVTIGCRSVQFTNPDGNPTAVIAYSGGQVRVRPGQSKTVKSDRTSISWTGTATLPKEPDSAIVSIQGQPHRKAFATAGTNVDLRQKCAVAATNASGSLAETGSSTMINILGPAGFAASVLGLTLLLLGRTIRLRRSTTRPRRG